MNNIPSQERPVFCHARILVHGSGFIYTSGKKDEPVTNGRIGAM